MSRGFLLDTNVVCEPGRRRPDPRVLAWLARTDAWHAFLSVLTIGEIVQGAAQLGTRGARYLTWLEASVLPHYQGRILPIDRDVATAWGELRGGQAQGGRTLPVIDSLLVATARVHSLTLVTRNVRDVRDLGVDVVDPGEASGAV